jgi:hypothetical protein
MSVRTEFACTKSRRYATTLNAVEFKMSRLWYGLVAIVIVASGCTRSVQINPSPRIPVASRWTAALASPSALAGAVQIRGSAWMAPPSSADSTRAVVAVEIANASPGGVHPWAVHEGSCGNDQGVFGSDRAYPPLRVHNDGSASATVTQTIPSPRTGSYFVEILASPSNTGLVIACGNLAAPQG